LCAPSNSTYGIPNRANQIARTGQISRNTIESFLLITKLKAEKYVAYSSGEKQTNKQTKAKQQQQQKNHNNTGKLFCQGLQ